MSNDIENLQRRLESIQKQFQAIETAYRNLQTSFSQIEAIFEFASALGTLIEIDELLAFVRKHFRDTFALDGFALVWNEDASAKKLPPLHVGLSAENFDAILAAHNVDLTAHLGADAPFVYLDDLADGSGAVEPGSLLCVRMASDKGLPFGVLALFKTLPGAFELQQRSFFVKLAAQLGRAIDKALLYERTVELSITDELTGVYNRRYFFQRYELEMQRASRYRRPMAVLMLDIDHFKTYNDTHGHLLGDTVLRQVAETMRHNLRKADILARYGGEEFVVLLPETSKEQAKKAGQKIRRKIEKTVFPRESTQPGGRMTVSMGLAAFPEDAVAAEQLLRSADDALYRAKGRGRNCVVWLESPGEEGVLEDSK